MDFVGDASKCDFCDPVSRKVVKLGELVRELLRGLGWLGRYSERLVTVAHHSGE